MTANAENFIEFCKTRLLNEGEIDETPLYKEKGCILYSGRESLEQQGGIYFMGLNPGGSADDPKAESIECNLNKVLVDEPKDFNVYWDENWRKHGYSPLQVRVHYLLKKLLGSEDVAKKTLCTNLIFFPTRRESGLNGLKEALAEECWPVHQWLLKQRKPKAIVTFGRFPFSYLLDKGNGKEEDFFLAGHGNWTVRHAKITLEGHQYLLIGLPHLSLYAINKDKHLDTVMVPLKEMVQSFIGIAN